ncbi:MAG: ankyrin repeat domain-containing protein [Bacteroidales bacterium]
MFEAFVNHDIKPGKLKKAYTKTLEQLIKGDFASAEVKKMKTHGLFRAKIDYENRLLFKFGRYKEESCLLVLEIIFNHDYQKSRFLRGAKIDEQKLEPVNNTQQVKDQEVEQLVFVNKKHRQFHVLDKILSFDDFQQKVLHTPLPQVIIGSAGSGKTALTLEKLKTLHGKVLYVTLSSYLAENAARIFFSMNYENENLEVDFLSFREFLEAWRVPQGREVEYKMFERWFERHRQATKLKDAHKTFEEFRGVITGASIKQPFLQRDEYLELGVKQSIFLEDERIRVYNLFEKYLQFLRENHLYDTNILAYEWLKYCEPLYDYIVVDEVQDLTNIQLHILLKSLKNINHFMLCGDANQIVHPNFFSWSHLKTMFFEQKQNIDTTSLLRVNYRNSKQVSELANRLLKIKIARFGSIDKESNFLVEASNEIPGTVSFVEDKNNQVAELNQKTRLSTGFAVLVMRDEDKAQAAKIFQTPLLFSVQDSKGLEYENIILYNFLTDNAAEFRTVCQGVSTEDVESDNIEYNRARDKKDKSAQVYKFYINSLYVAITRAVKNVYMVENNRKHDLFKLLGVISEHNKSAIKENVSSADDWKREAGRLQKQGKTEQASAIYEKVLKTSKPDWKPIDQEAYVQLKKDALNPEHFNHKAKKQLYNFALAYNHHTVMLELAKLKFKKAEKYENDRNGVFRKHYPDYQSDNLKQIVQKVNRYGINFRDQFNFSPLHAAAMSGAINICQWLIEFGANPYLHDTFGRTPLQISILQAFNDQAYAQTRVETIYPLLAREPLRLQVDEKLVKIEPVKTEYFLVNLFIAVQTSIVQKKGIFEPMGVKIDDILDNLELFPETILPSYRKKRKYMQPQLSKHEADSNNPYNKKLFKRIDRGYYILNPELKILINEQWHKTDDIINMQDFSEEETKKHAMERYIKERDEMKKRIEKESRRWERRNEGYGYL